MSLFDWFPSSTPHELNLDWIIKKMREVLDSNERTAKIADEVEKFVQTNNWSEDVSEAVKEIFESGGFQDIIDSYIAGTVRNYAALEQEITTVANRVTALLESEPQEGEVTDIRTGYNGTVYETAGDAVRGQVSDLWAGVSAGFGSVLNRVSPQLSGASRGHLYEIAFDNTNDVVWLTKDGGAYAPYKTLKGSPIMEAPRRLCFAFDTDAKIVLNFFQEIEGTMTQVHDIFEYVTGTGRVNYMGAGDVPGRVIDCPEGTFFNVAIYEGNCRLYGWDAEPFGPPVSATMDYLNTDGTISVLRTGGGCLLTIPGHALAVCVDGGAIRTIGRVKNGVVQEGVSGNTARFALLPGDADFYIVTYLPGYDFTTNTYDKTTIDGIVEGVHIAADCDIVGGYGAAHKVLENCRRVAATRWTPAANIEGSGTVRTFKAGVSYSGLPYCSTWQRVGLVGWHISRRTFQAAVADPNSIFYKERVNAEDNAPPYGINCSAFATMCQGWKNPVTNVDMVSNPEYIRRYEPELIPGNIYTNNSHCFICGEVVRNNDGTVSAVAHEAVTPIMGSMVRYSEIPDTDFYAYNHTRGAVYFNRYFVSPFPSAIGEAMSPEEFVMGDMSNNYFDTNAGAITAGSARPYRGNYSVYTDTDHPMYIAGEEALELSGIKINIHRADATNILLYNEADSLIATIPINNQETVDISDYVNISGVYSVCTDVDIAREHFEYIKIADRRYYPVLYMFSNGMTTTRGDDYAEYEAIAYRGRYGAAIFQNVTL